MNSRTPILSLLVYLLLAPAAFASQCSGSGPRPEWVDSPESVTPEYFYAAGVSADPDASLSERIATAKQNALKSLSEVIEVSVKNSLILEQSSRNISGNELTDSNLRSITNTTTQASLRNVESVATWEDRSSCDLWLQIRVSKKNVEQGKREGLAKTLFSSMNEQLNIVRDETQSPSIRMAAIDSAMDVLSRIALEFIPEANSRDYYSALLNRHKKSLQRILDNLAQAKMDLSSSEQLINKASGQINETEKSKTLGEAASIYKNLLAKHTKGLPPVFETGDILFKLGEVEELRGSSCGAKNYFQKAADSVQIVDRKEVARKKAESLPCTSEDMDKTLWRQYFEGRPTIFICYFRTNTDRGTWNKACDGLNNIIRPLGADISLRAKALSAQQLETIQNGGIPEDFVESGKIVLGIFALGKINNRIDKDSRGQDREYQFDGSMTTFILDGDSTTFSDRFQGRTGWNPISPEMVMDILGINVVKRWKDKFSKFLRHELTQ